jgi:hypothetical protein
MNILIRSRGGFAWSGGDSCYDGQNQWERLHGRTILRGKPDSLADALASGTSPLTEVAVGHAALLLPVPGEDRPTPDPSQQFPRGQSAVVLAIIDSLIARLDSTGFFCRSVGARLHGAFGRFPTTTLYELRLTVPPPWRCAVVAADSGRGVV